MYKQPSKLEKKKYLKLGGLGPNIGGDSWQKSKSKMEKMQAFSAQVRNVNNHKIIPIDSLAFQERERRQKMDNPRNKAI